jgi:endoribonuclease Dicer
LKYLSSVYVFVTHPAQHEGALHVSRQKIISNKSLLQNACRAGLPPYIQAKPFTLRLWQPPNFSILPNSGPNIAKEENKEKGDIICDVDDDAQPADAQTPAQNLEHEAPSTSSEIVPMQSESGVPTENNRPKKKSKKKKQQDEQYTQMLGDKVRSFTLG